MKAKLILITILLAFFNLQISAQQCLNGGCSNFTNQYPPGTLTSTTSWQTHCCMNAGNWTLFTVTSGNTYEWSYCESSGGISTNWDAQLTLYNNNNITSPICFSTDVCGNNGNAPYIRWTANFTGTVRLLTTYYSGGIGCRYNTGAPYNTLAWRVISASSQYGSVNVAISPSNAVNTGAQWCLDGSNNWQNSAVTVNSITTGNHTVNFKSISGWTSPNNQTINVTTGSTSFTTGAYSQNTQYGSVNVTINPTNAVNTGAQWCLDGTNNWQNSGVTLNSIITGNHTLNFKNISGWTSPNSQTINVSNSNTSFSTGTYSQNTQYGSIKVTINPSSATGAKWNLDGSNNWQTSGVTLSNIPTGNHTLNFNSISGWISPANQSVNIINNSTSNITAIYSQNAVGLPDLTIQNPQISSSNAVANSSTLISFTVKNVGTVTAPISVTSVHLSSDNIFQSGIDLYLKDTTTFSLAPGGAQNITMQVRIPSGTAPGVWYLLISANGTSAFHEIDYSNNTSFVTFNTTACFASIDNYKRLPNYDGLDNFDCKHDIFNPSDVDYWNFYKYQCVSYVAFKVNESWGYVYPNKKFTNQYTNPRLSDAKYWASRLQAKNYLVDRNPAVGSIAWYDGHPAGTQTPNGAGPQGHVAFVDCISGSVITLSEYNWVACSYGTRNVDMSAPSVAGVNRPPDLFIHIEVGGLGSNSIGSSIFDTPFDFTAYPNPSTGNINLSFNNPLNEAANFGVYNLMGQLILTQQLDINSSQFYLNLSNISNGIYIIRIKSSTFNVAKKITITH